MKKHPVHRAFTLIELLTVIAIIGILAAILIPVVGSVRHSARSAQSLSNLRQIGLVTALYANDNSDRFPFLNRSPTNIDSSDQFFWPQALEVLLFNWDRHASTPQQKHEIFIDPTVESGMGHPISDYGANMFLFSDANPANPARATTQYRMSFIEEPSKIAMVVTARGPNDRASWYTQTRQFASGESPGNVPDARLNSGNVGAVFVDGHVEAIPRSEIFDDRIARRSLFDPSYYSR
jgi:prepilin-type N-terminal cleavage/methylation domain-containing protein/prepilin-type processing-associated H-X9-DG protein